MTPHEPSDLRRLLAAAAAERERAMLTRLRRYAVRCDLCGGKLRPQVVEIAGRQARRCQGCGAYRTVGG